MTHLLEIHSAQRGASPLDSFSGTIARTRTGPVYLSGLGIVALAMVILPLLYLALVVMTGWLIFLHLRYDTWILGDRSTRAGFAQFILYAGPAIAGCILLFFMVKPFFAAKVKAPAPITLDPQKEPLLFAFVRKICGLVGAAVPCRIDVDCQVNASASLRRGLFSKDLVLTIGLPLVSGLDMRQFAGVLAHEFGHFAQGAGMRMTYIIRRINFWFARVVYERDEWDVKLDQSARGADFRIGAVLQMARGCVWVTRRILWALMHAGHAISCFMLRQMEYDADSYEAKLAGSDVFETTASQLRVLNVANQTAYEDVRQAWTSHRLPEDLPLLIGHKAGCLPSEILQKLQSSAAAEKTRWFNTHPCDADRVRAARRLNEPGVFRVCQPATALFSDFSEISRVVTRHQYSKHLELEFSDKNLIAADEILRESTAQAEAKSMVMKYYGAVNISLAPLLIPEEPLSSLPVEAAQSEWQLACRVMTELREKAEQSSADWGEKQQRLVTLATAHAFADAGFKLDPTQFGLPENATSPGDQEVATRFAIEEISAALKDPQKQVETYVAALRRRMMLSLQVAPTDSDPANEENRPELNQLVSLLTMVGQEMLKAHAMGLKLQVFVQLARTRGQENAQNRVNRVGLGLAGELKSLVEGVQARLKRVPYPFAHARGRLTVAEYLRSEQSSSDLWENAYFEANAHVERMFALNFRLIGRVLALMDQAERVFSPVDPSTPTG